VKQHVVAVELLEVDCWDAILGCQIKTSAVNREPQAAVVMGGEVQPSDFVIPPLEDICRTPTPAASRMMIVCRIMVDRLSVLGSAR